MSPMKAHSLAPKLPPETVGCSNAWLQLLAEVSAAASNDFNTLITGESGTGKELAARAIHQASARSKGPFVVVDCASLPDSLVEAELFGHQKGAFTGALTSREGLFRAAHGGTLFLDEIGELPLSLQPKLLRVIEQKVVRQLGSDSSHPVDVRIVAATNRDLEAELLAARFRPDLYYRLAVMAVQTPPLRLRQACIPALAHSFLLRANEQITASPETANNDQRIVFEPDAVKLLCDYPWPGNVRQLKNIVERAASWTPGRNISAYILSGVLPALRPPAAPLPFAPTVFDNPSPEMPKTEAPKSHDRKIKLEADYTPGDNIRLFLDRALIEVYDKGRQQAGGSHSGAARLFNEERVALQHKITRARSRLLKSQTSSHENH